MRSEAGTGCGTAPVDTAPVDTDPVDADPVDADPVDAGMVTAELAACLPVLVLLLAVSLTAVSAVGARVRLQDAAREAARAAARGDTAAGRRLAARAAPGAEVAVSRGGGDVVAVASIRVHPLGGVLPGFTVQERAVAAAEPTIADP